MITLRQIERSYNARTYERLLRDLSANRPESLFHFDGESGWAALAAAMAVIRLDELSQSHSALCGKLIRALIASQEADGGWGDPAATSLVLRALLCGQGNGVAIERGLKYLADLQKPEGIWPAVPIRRMPADAQTSAFVLHQLAGHACFRKAVRIDDAVAWFQEHGDQLDDASRRLWERASFRCPAARAPLTSAGAATRAPLNEMSQMRLPLLPTALAG
jgi:hypothetical protein